MVVDLLTGLLRTKFLNPKYLEMKQLRGNNPNLQYHYLQLRKSKKVDEFLTHFPMYAKHFEHFLEQFKTFGKRVRSVYWEVFVKKTKPFEELKYRDKFFVQKLHYEVFLPQHRENKKFFITDEIVEVFLDRDDVMVPI
jgi:hypothetical protein